MLPSIAQVVTRRNRTAPDPQLTFNDWQTVRAEPAVETSTPVHDPAPPPIEPERALPDVDAVTTLAEVLAPRLAEQLAARLTTAPQREPAGAPLLTLDELVAELPPAKPPKTWKRWLYERTRRGDVPGCVKLGGMLFFEQEPVRAWIRSGAGTPQSTRR